MRTTVIEATASLCLALALAAGCRKQAKPEEALDTSPLVRVGSVAPAAVFTDGVQVQGTLRTKYSASVAARVGGALDEVMADEGDAVKAGQPLFQVDKVNLENRVRLAQDDLSVARAQQKEAEAALQEALAAYEKASVDAGRMKRLFEEDQAVTKDTWEKADLQAKLATATCARLRAAIESADARIVQAETALSVARKNLSDSLGAAPFDGVITRKRLNRGDFVNVGTAVFELDDPQAYEVSFSLNAAHYDRVAVGQTRVRFADGQDAAVTYKAPSVHPVTRTFEIRVTVDKTPELAPGMIRDARVVFRRYTAAAVPSQAVGLRAGKRQVFAVRSGVVAGIAVETGLEWQGQTEIRNPELLKGEDIVTEGMLLLNEGDKVRIKRDAPAKPGD